MRDRSRALIITVQDILFSSELHLCAIFHDMLIDLYSNNTNNKNRCIFLLISIKNLKKINLSTDLKTPPIFCLCAFIKLDELNPT